jgi:hypothetical protein
VKASGSYIGGVVGQKSGKTIQDVFFLSTVTPKEIADGSKAPPVDAVNGGGIVGQVYNSGTVTRALYLAVAPMSGSTIYPIDRSGSAAVTDSFYLYGLKYRVMPGGDWTEELYNDGTVSGGGEPMNTLELDLASLVYLDEVDMPGWDDGAKGYPYPILSKMESPTSWPEADGSDRPAQASRSDWGEQYTDAWPELAFVNGDFGEPYLPGKLNNVGLSQPDSGRTGVETVPNYGVNFGHDIYTYMTSVPGWSTRPSTSDTGIYANDQYIIEPMMPYPYVDSGNAYWGLMQTDYKGNGTSSGGDLRNSPNDATYVELNAEVPGTLYQIADTIPGQEFYWSFHHASRLAMSWDATAGNDAMNFYLSPVGTTRRDPLGNSIADDLWLIRPVESPRNVVRPNNSAVNYPADAASSNPNNTSLTGYNYAAWNTVKYLPDTTKGMEKYWAKHFQGFPASGVYLYDVWIGDKAEGGNGYGLTFWSTTNYNNLDINGYADIGGLETALGAGSADAKKIIGYWDIDNGWKQYYGRYIVPEGQTRTEFAYQSVRGTNDAYGNFLDGAVFKAEATLSVSETMYRTATQNGAVTPREVAGVVDAGDTITVEMTVKALGGAGTAQARNIQLRNQLKPFDQYVEFAGNVTVGGNSASSGYDYTDGVFTMPLEIAPGGEITVSFDIKVLSHIAGKTPPYSTLFYFIENQAEVHYTSYHEGQQISAAGYRRSSNASEQNQRVSISEIPMSKTVALVGNLDADGNLAPVDPVTTSETAPQVGETGSVFEVELNFSGKVAAAGFVSDTLPKDFSLVEGSIQKLAANGTWEPVEEDDRILYGTDGTDLRLVFLDVDFAAAAEQTYSFRYRMTYTGDGFGITYAGVDAYYRFRYDLNSIQLPVIEPKLGIRATAPDDAFTIPPTGGSIDLRQKANIKTILPYDGTALLPVIVFTDADGNPVDLDQTKFMAVLSGDGQLTLSPLVNGGTIAEGTYTLYYKTEAKETEAGGFDLSSRVAEITIEVSSSAPDPQAALPAPDAPNPAPDAVLPPVAAATLGLLGAALGGGLGLKNGVSTAVAALLGAVSLLLVLTGLVLLPEKKRRPRREKRG